jgi:hypothetical protein
VHRVRDHIGYFARGGVWFFSQPSVKEDGNPYYDNGNDAWQNDIRRALRELLAACGIILFLGILL